MPQNEIRQTTLYSLRIDVGGAFVCANVNYNFTGYKTNILWLARALPAITTFSELTLLKFGYEEKTARGLTIFSIFLSLLLLSQTAAAPKTTTTHRRQSNKNKQFTRNQLVVLVWEYYCVIRNTMSPAHCGERCCVCVWVQNIGSRAHMPCERGSNWKTFRGFRYF